MMPIFEEYALILDEIKSSENISQVSLWGEQPKPNVYVGYTLLMCVLGIPSFLVLFLIMIPSHDVHISLSPVT